MWTMIMSMSKDQKKKKFVEILLLIHYIKLDMEKHSAQWVIMHEKKCTLSFSNVIQHFLVNKIILLYIAIVI